MHLLNNVKVNRSACPAFLIPFFLVSSLFFLWGFAHSILEVLNPHFQASFHLSKTQAAWVQAAVYGGYFLMAMPAGSILRRWGYKAGVLTGLWLYGLGALLFIPGSTLQSFPFFVGCLFIIGCGLTCLETSANPYVTVLGSPEGAERRINLAQSLNGLGWIVGPLVGGQLLFSGGDIALPYTGVGLLVCGVAVVFSRLKLPEIAEAEEESDAVDNRLWTPAFYAGMGALFLYVAAQTGVNSFFINYMVEQVDMTPTLASRYLGFGGMGLFVLGRLSGSWLMNYLKPVRLLGIYAGVSCLATVGIVAVSGYWTLGLFFLVYLCESIMFPTIFSLALRDCHGHTKRASSYLIMTIVGGALSPLLMGMIADATGDLRVAYMVPLICFVGIALYSILLIKLR